LTISQEAVREFQVVINQFSPEFGNAGGGLVNLASRSGANDFHGDGILFWRNEAKDARNASSRRRSLLNPTRGLQRRVVRSGRIRHSSFASAEYLDRNQTGVVTMWGSWGTALAASPMFGQYLATADPRRIQLG
jgi:hypothetical protein